MSESIGIRIHYLISYGPVNLYGLFRDGGHNSNNLYVTREEIVGTVFSV